MTPHLLSKQVTPKAILLKTRRVKAGADFKGGIVSFGQVERDLRPLLQDSSVALVTTLLDYYGLPEDFPQYDHRPAGTCFERVAFLERAFRDAIGHPRFLPYLALHEYEAMMFVDPARIDGNFPEQDALDALKNIRDAFASPEEINEDEPPSKRLEAVYSTYQKPFHGPLVVAEIGLAAIRQQCAHFAGWLAQLEALGES